MTISRAEYENMQPQIQWLIEQLRLSRQKRFGASSEQTSKEAMEQLSLLYNEAEVCADQTASGAKSSAVIFSLIQTATENGLDPYRCLIWLLSSAAEMDVDQSQNARLLLPWNAPAVYKI